jgi:acyl carrier protein
MSTNNDDMKLSEFTEKVKSEFMDEEIPLEFDANTPIKRVDGWSSIHALLLIALVDINFGVTLSGDDLSKCDTLKDLYELVEQKRS